MAAIMDNKDNVEIGVLEECDSFLLESRYFPNKLGGKPAWLDLRNLPRDYTCGVCNKTCIFLCQVYAPIDANATCHHRTLFIFVCPDPECCKTNVNLNFKVYRCQLPEKNEFYTAEDPTEDKDWHPECKVENFTRVCQLCGNYAPFNCAKCKSAAYCSKQHQIADWKTYGHKVNCGSNVEDKLIEVPFLFPEFEITIDKPPEMEPTTKTDQDRLQEFVNLVNNGQTGSLADVPENLLDQFSSIDDDRFFAKYKKCIDECPEQVLRYDRGGTPLYVAQPELPTIPDCPYCNAERQFEFQILSTVLNEIGGNDIANGLDWGTLIIYTCKNNCDLGPAYKTEFLIKQDVK